MRSIILAALFLSGCAFTIDKVTLKHPSGQMVECPGFTMWTPGQTAAATALQRGCIEDYRAQGYVRTNGDEQVQDAQGRKIR
jgi:hypothetical protein